MNRWGRLWSVAATLNGRAGPRWTQNPNGIADVSELRNDQCETVTTLLWDDGTSNMLDRLFADVAEQTDDSRPTRQLPCWVSLEASTVVVHVGRERLGTIDSGSARVLIEHHGGDRRAVGTFAQLHGTGPSDATFTVHLPDRV